jgi:branched-chain amino acid transport system permease protein
MTYFTQLLIDALLLGGIYTLMAIGLSLSYGVARVINFAHGEAVMLGAYGAFWGFRLLGLDPLMAIPAVAMLGIVAGAIVFRLTILPILDSQQENQILLTFGIGLVLQSLAVMAWSADERATNPDYALSSFELGDLVVPGARLIGCAVAGVLVAILFLWLKFTELGRASRALADNREAAGLMGINVPAMFAFVFGLGVALGDTTGAIVSFILPVTPFMGFSILIKSFAIVVLGGLGSIVGTVIGAFVVAFAETAVAYYVPDGNGWAEAVAFAILFVVLVVRPNGILGTQATL